MSDKFMVDLNLLLNGKQVAEGFLRKLWSENFTEPYPNAPLLVMIISSKKFKDVCRRIQKRDKKLIDASQMYEYGEPQNLNNLMAFTTVAMVNGQKTILIVRRSNSKYPLEKDLIHELGHIASGDLNYDWLEK